MKKELKQILFFSIIILVVDQIIKFFVSDNFTMNQSFILIKNYLNITLVHNKGAAFSILNGNIIFLILVGIITVIGILYYLSRVYVKKIDLFIYSLLLGGILGNLLDRIIHGYVIDYISFNFGEHYFPVFNFADVCIIVSIIMILFNTIREDLWKSK